MRPQQLLFGLLSVPLLLLALDAAELPPRSRHRLENCDVRRRHLRLHPNAGVGTELVTVRRGLQLDSLFGGGGAGDYLARRGDSLVLARVPDWSRREALPLQQFRCGPDLMTVISFVLDVAEDDEPEVLQDAAEVRLWRFAPAGTPVHNFLAQRPPPPGACPGELQFAMLAGPPCLRVGASDGRLQLAAPLPAEAPDRLAVHVRARDPATNRTLDTVLSIVLWQLWRRPQMELKAQNSCNAAAAAKAIKTAGSHYLLEPDASLAVLWSSDDEATVADATGESTTMAMIEAELHGARERVLLRVACRRPLPEGARRTGADGGGGGDGGGGCAFAAAGSAVAGAFASAAIFAAVVAVAAATSRRSSASSCLVETPELETSTSLLEPNQTVGAAAAAPVSETDA